MMRTLGILEVEDGALLFRLFALCKYTFLEAYNKTMSRFNITGTESISFLSFNVSVLRVQFEVQDEHFMMSQLISDISLLMIVKYPIAKRNLHTELSINSLPPFLRGHFGDSAEWL